MLKNKNIHSKTYNNLFKNADQREIDLITIKRKTKSKKKMRMSEKNRKRENEIDPERDNFRLTCGIVRVR